MQEIMRTTCADVDTELVEVTGENNHVHLLVNVPPKLAPAKPVNTLKGVSFCRVHRISRLLPRGRMR
jgi:putative transposase